MILGIDKKQLEKNLLARLDGEAGLWDRIVEDSSLDWVLDTDASYDDGCWSDDSRWRVVTDLLGYRVEISARPSWRYAKFEEEPGIGEPARVEVLG